jgi:ABC-type multidrug transport system fused ATPase/permease subunit
VPFIPLLSNNPSSRSSLFRKIVAANSLDFILDFAIKLCSVFFTYCAPIFLRLILETISSAKTRREIALGFVYAILMFVTGVMKAQMDVKHLWHGRRTATRLRSELMAALYEKALKRKDFSGVTQDRAMAGSSSPEEEGDGSKGKGAKDSKKDKKGNKASDAKKDEGKDGHKKAGADIGKIVQLMAGDTNRIAMTTSGLYFIYVCAPSSYQPRSTLTPTTIGCTVRNHHSRDTPLPHPRRIRFRRHPSSYSLLPRQHLPHEAEC